MKQSSSIALAACLTLAACQGSKTKTTWQTVTETRPDKLAASADPSEAYANKLHKVLAQANVEHKVITYQYRYETRLREQAMGTHSAVIYKDESNSLNPWWLMDDRLRKPVWLPGDNANKQVAFYLRRDAQVVAQTDFSVRDPQATQTMIAKQTPVVPAHEPAVTRIAKAKAVPARVTALAQTTVEPAPSDFRPFIRPARFSPAANEVTIPFTAPAPTGERYDDLFRRTHGTQYDPSSPIDRRKMETIKHAHLDTPTRSATRTF